MSDDSTPTNQTPDSGGWVKLYYSIQEWEWYKIPNMVSLWLHLLFKANWKDGRFQGHVIKRGQLVTGRKALAEETGLSERQIRTCLTRLKSTSEIAIKTTNRFSIITILNYCKYQDNKSSLRPADRPATGPTSDQQTTTIEEYKNNKTNNNININNSSSICEADKLPKKKKPKKVVPPLVFPPELDTEQVKTAWAEWTAAQRGKGRPWPRVYEQHELDRLAKLGPEYLLDCIDTSMRKHNWGKLIHSSEVRDNGHGYTKETNIDRGKRIILEMNHDINSDTIDITGDCLGLPIFRGNT